MIVLERYHIALAFGDYVLYVLWPLVIWLSMDVPIIGGISRAPSNPVVPGFWWVSLDLRMEPKELYKSPSSWVCHLGILQEGD